MICPWCKTDDALVISHETHTARDYRDGRLLVECNVIPLGKMDRISVDVTFPWCVCDRKPCVCPTKEEVVAYELARGNTWCR